MKALICDVCRKPTDAQAGWILTRGSQVQDVCSPDCLLEAGLKLGGRSKRNGWKGVAQWVMAPPKGDK